jgi:excinuclease ABC subunit C
MLAKAESIDFVSVVSESEALLLEHNLIKKHRPPYNNLIRGDNAYYYIKITHEPFAQIVLTKLKYDDGGIYIGPKANAKELKKLLQFLRQLLQYR